ncbi:MAG: hypothetical protein EOM54_13500 [Clostridia bacterium]|nr:hypothetical protein [Clostridia bacterium]
MEIMKGNYREQRQQIRRERKNGNAQKYVAVTDKTTGQSTMFVFGNEGSKVHVSLSACSSSTNS